MRSTRTIVNKVKINAKINEKINAERTPHP